jgi:pimeloyl-ACP methyl ester carboxylesterase
MIRALSLALIGGLLAACAVPGVPGSGSPSPAPPAPTQVTRTPEPAATATTVLPPTPEATTATAAPEARAASYEQAGCRFDVPPGAEVECGYLNVPERRDRPDSRTIRLHVAIYKSSAASPAPDPVVYLEGGPGGDALKSVALGYDRRVVPFLEERDFIVFDQRGTGFSEPSLDCPELSALSYELLDDDLSVEESTERYVAETLACRTRLGQEEIDFSAYNSVESAADLADLREALGYAEWNLYGISYGTRLALTAMREHPEGVRSVILDSAVPLQSGEDETPGNIARAFEQLFEGCAASASCRAAYPDLESEFYELVDRLNEAPVTEPVVDPLDGQRYTLLLNGDSLFGVVTQALYSTDLIVLLPLAIHAAATEVDYSLLARLAMIGTVQGQFISEGMFYSVRCHEEIAFTTEVELAAADDPFPELRGVFDQSSYAPICAAWGAGAADPVENQPVESDIPTLVLAGEYDPATPPEDGRIAAATLTNSTFLEFPGLGHGVSADGGCPLNITLAFLRDPGAPPDASCIADMQGPSFVAAGAEVRMAAVERDGAGFRGVAPEGWEEQSDGVFARPSGDVALLLQVAQAASAQLLGALAAQFGLEDTPEAIGSREAMGLDWTLYRMEIQGQPADLALAERGQQTFMVLLVSNSAEREHLYEQVFLPAIDAFEPL